MNMSHEQKQNQMSIKEQENTISTQVGYVPKHYNRKGVVV